MKRYHDLQAEKLYVRGRPHPWTTSNNHSPGQYYDLRTHPELIRTALEDFRPWEKFPAIDVFYKMLEWLNGPDSILESSDCMLLPPTVNESPKIANKKQQIMGRLFFLHRQLDKNADENVVNSMLEGLHESLELIDPAFEFGCIAYSRFPTLFTSSGEGRPPYKGHTISLKYWAWGDDDTEAFQNLKRTFENLHQALRSLSGQLKMTG